MTEIVAHFQSAQDTPLVSPASVPTIRIRRVDTGALVVTDQAMTELGDGAYSYAFTPVVGLEYSIRADGDPAAAGQTIKGGRYMVNSLCGDTVWDIPTAGHATAGTFGGDIPLLTRIVDGARTVSYAFKAAISLLNGRQTKTNPGGGEIDQTWYEQDDLTVLSTMRLNAAADEWTREAP